MHQFIETIRRLRLDRATVGYTVAAWAIVQAAALAAGAFAWPNWILQIVIVGALLGFPAVLVFAWVLAVRREHGSAFRPTRSDVVVLANLGAVFLVAAAVLVLGFWPRVHSNRQIATELDAPPASVAVLPFANVGGDPRKRYFSDGLSDELINELARIPTLRVAARSSSFAFAGKSQDARAIARSLNVHAVLEGSVREAGNRVRINAQLVSGTDGYQIWAQSYDRELTDILALQEEIARSVTTALSARLLPKVHRESIGAQAYRLYLQGKYFSAKANAGDLEKAIALFRRTNEAAPRYAPAFAESAAAALELAEVFGKSNWLSPAEVSATKAHDIDPENLQALTVMAEIAIDKWDWAKATEMYGRARTINPNNVFVQHLRSVLANIFQYPQEMLAAEEKALTLNPLSFGLKFNIANWYLAVGNYQKAAEMTAEALKIQPANLDARSQQCLIAVRSGKLDEAKHILRTLAAAYTQDPQNFGDCPFELAIAMRDPAEARRVVDRAAADFLANSGYATTIGDHYRQLRDFRLAMEWYERAYVNREVLLFAVPYERNPDKTFLATPAWKSLWAREPIRVWLAARTQFGKTIVKPES
jgi:adenylate cyclase